MILQGLAVQPEKRPASAREFARILREYLAHVGFPNIQLADWMEGGSSFTLEALSAMAATLKGRCDHALRSSDSVSFGADLSHLGAVAPESDSVTKLLREADALRNARRLRRRILPAIAAGFFIVLSFGGAWFWKQSTIVEDQLTVPASAKAEPATIEAPAVPTIQPRQIARAAVETKLAKRLATSPVRVDVPSDIRMYWNGERVLPDRGLPEQKVGFHELRLEKDGMRPIVQRIQVKAGEPTVIRVR
jgi:hypothetical protein